MIEARQGYIEAREIIAKNLNLKESHRDNERLTLDSSNYSIHLIFYIPDPPDIYVTKKGEAPSWDTSFLSFFSRKNPNEKQRDEALMKLFQSYSKINTDCFSQFLIKINFFKQNYPCFFV